MRVQILDHGYLEVVETWGSDERIIEAARMSTDKGFKGWGLLKCRWCPATSETGKLEGRCPGGRGGAHENHDGFSAGDEKLLRYLWENKHATPFEMAGAIIEVQAPIFVFREWHRHRTQSYNELSARYTPMPDINYVPSVDRVMLNASGSNKQAGTVAGADQLTPDAVHAFRSALIRGQDEAEERYQDALRSGVPKELARLHIPVARYSRMRAGANLRNWLAFLTLRNHPHAQWEIRQYAIALQAELARAFPRTVALFAGGEP